MLRQPFADALEDEDALGTDSSQSSSGSAEVPQNDYCGPIDDIEEVEEGKTAEDGYGSQDSGTDEFGIIDQLDSAGIF